MEETLGAAALGICGSMQGIESKAEAMTFAINLTTKRDFSTGESIIDKEKAIEVYRLFTENIDLPDTRSQRSNEMEGLTDSYKTLIDSLAKKLEKQE